MGKHGVGQPVSRTEDPRFLTGRGQYVADIDLPRQAHGFVVRSPHAHADVTRLDVARALNAPGVLAVLTGQTLIDLGIGGVPCHSLPPAERMDKPAVTTRYLPLAINRVRHVGEGIAFVVAESADLARDAGEQIEADFDPLPASAAIEDASAEDAPVVWDGAPDNLCFRIETGDRAATDGAFDRAAHVTELLLVNNRVSANPIEPRGSIGDYHAADDRFTLYTSTQTPHRTRHILAAGVLGIPETRLRVVARDVGGGFGMKGAVYPEDALCLLAARQLGRPVKWIAERGESFLSDSHGRDQLCRGAMAFDDKGRIIGFRVVSTYNMGAYLMPAAPVSPIHGATLFSGTYAIPAIHCTVEGVFTNTQPMSPYRGAGMPEAAYLIERLIEKAGGELGVDAVELRRRNFVPPSAMPYQTALEPNYDSGEFEAAMDLALDRADHAGFAARRAASEMRGRRRGFGIASYIESVYALNERMEIRFDASGDVTIVAGTFSHGQGHRTVYAQMIAEWLGVAPDDVNLIQGDTDQVSFGRGTYGSRSMVSGGSALRAAADEVIARGAEIAAHLLEAAVDDMAFADGVFTVAGTDRSVSLVEVARQSFAIGGMPPELGVGIEGRGTFAARMGTYPNGCHAAEVEVDVETGVVDVVRYSVGDDFGLVLNPLLLEGQVHGGVAQGIGQALLERIAYDRGSGQLLSASFLDYGMPRADDLPFFDVATRNVPTPSNPLGVKGAGEAGAVGAPPAVVNAILDALRPLGVTHLEMPATPERVWRAIHDAKRG